MDQIDPPPLKATRIPTSIGKLTVRPGDSLVVFRADESVEVFANIEPGQLIKRPAITAIGVYWLMETPDWRGKLDFRTADRIKEIINGSTRDQFPPSGNQPHRKPRRK